MLNHVHGQVWKRVWEMAFFGLKLGLDLEMQAAHPHHKFQRVSPPPPRSRRQGLGFRDPSLLFAFESIKSLPTLD